MERAPRLIRKVSNADGITLWEDAPAVNEVIDTGTARTMMTLLRAVTQHGTGAAAAQLNHPLGGKTGTTSDFTDAWFLGFSPSVTCGVWVGYDSRESLGDKETGAKAALPIWMSVMKVAIAGKDGEQFLGDQQTPPLERAAVQPPANGAAAKAPMLSPTSASTAKPGKAIALVTQAAAPVPTGPHAKAAAESAAKPQVKSALSSRPAPARPQPAVKPALETSPDPKKQ